MLLHKQLQKEGIQRMTIDHAINRLCSQIECNSVESDEYDDDTNSRI